MTLADKALAIATEAHMGQVRKVDKLPYIAHPIEVARMVHKAGFPDKVVAAALVHDVLEDTPYDEDLLRAQLGDGVVNIVKEVTENKARPWRERKEQYIAHIRAGSTEAQVVSLADKIHNLRGMLEGYKKTGDHMWSEFTRGKEDTVWYYGEMLRVFEEKLDHPMVGDYASLVERLRAL